MKKILLAFLFFSVITTSKLDAQSCFNVNAGNDTTMSCLQTCMDLHARIPDLRSSETYQVVPIAYNPYPYTTVGGTTDPLVNADDHFSDSFALPFPFCFYGNTYSKAVVGSNGVVSFDVRTNATTIEGYVINPGDTIWFAGGSPNVQTMYYAPRASIFLAYVDLNPATSPAGNKIEWRVEGVAPCRRFVVSFYHIGNYDLGGCPNNPANLTTMQAVLYEGSGIIDVFYENKPACTAYQGGLSIAGVQNWGQDQAITPAGWNGTVWTASNQGIRYVPSGPTSLLDSVVLYKNNVSIATGVATPLGNGEMDALFSNICQSVDSMSYVIKAFYRQCDNPAVETEGSDTIIVRKTLNPLTVTTSPTSCPASNNGLITVTNPVAANIEYSINNGVTWQSSPVFNTVAGNYTVIARVVASTCTGSTTVTVIAGSTPLSANLGSTPSSCPAVADGTITVTPGSGTAPYQFSLDGGPNQLGNVFTNVLAGAHNVTITDVNGCTGSFPIVVAAGPALTANLTSTATSCPVLSDGTITATPTNGTAPYQYSLDGGPFQPGNVFTNVASGPHNVTISDANTCANNFPVVVTAGSALGSNINGVNPPCSNINNGTITVTPTAGIAPFQYRLNGGPPQGSNVFGGLAPGPYTVDFTDVNGCVGTNNIVLTSNPAITATASVIDPLCNGNANGSITINATGGVPPFQYSKNGGASYQPGNVFNGLIAGNYTIRVKDAAGCIYDFPYTLSQPPVLTISTVPIAATCPNNDGSITITAGGGTLAYNYSIDGGANYSVFSTFINLPVGPYNVIVKDANGCTASVTETVLLNDTMRLELGPDSTICFGSSMILIPQTNLLTDTFRWRPSTGLNYDTAQNPVAKPLDTTKYILLAKWGVCQREDSLTINVLHKPVAHAGNDTTICYKSFAILNGVATNLSGSVNYAWAPAATVAPPNFPTTVATPDSTQLYILTVTDNYGCNFSVADSILVIMEAPVPAFAGNDTNAVVGQPHQLRATGGTKYLWTPAGPLNNSNSRTPLATMYTDTYFKVLVTDAIGCTATDDIFIKVYPGPTYHVPNAFSPNGDGLNDIFRPIPAGMATTDYFMVYNRYGELVFQTREWLKGWDGKFKGKDASAGVYVWMIKGLDNTGKVIQMQGTVMLIR